jgi:pimeloyl-ACP methyl ester carboxylesterase
VRVWGEANKDPNYADLDRLVTAARSISTPTLMIQGGSDAVTLPATTEGNDRYFTGGYARHVLPGIGHFPTREAPEATNKLVPEFLRGGICKAVNAAPRHAAFSTLCSVT